MASDGCDGGALRSLRSSIMVRRLHLGVESSREAGLPEEAVAVS